MYYIYLLYLYTSLFYSNSNNLVVPIQNFKTTYMIEKLKGFFFKTEKVNIKSYKPLEFTK